MPDIQVRVFEVGKFDVLLKYFKIASTCNKVLRKLFLKPKALGLIPTGGDCGNINYSKKGLM